MVRDDVDRSAPVLVRCEQFIRAPVERLWRIHLDVNAWPNWQHDISRADLSGEFAPGQSFTWSTAGIDTPIVSTIYGVEHQRRTLWGGLAQGIEGVHAWSFEPQEDGVRVVTEESFRGEPADAAPDQVKELLTASLDRWLENLADAVKSGG